MFDVAHLGRVWWPVEMTTYDEAGAERTVTLRALFSPLTRAERQERQREITRRSTDAVKAAAASLDSNALRIDPDADPAEEAARIDRAAADAVERITRRMEQAFEDEQGDIDLLLARTHDIRGLSSDGEDVAFTPEIFASLLAYQQVYAAFAQAFDACSAGAVRKNSSPGPAGKPARGQS